MVIYYVVLPALLTFAPWLVVRHVFANPHSRNMSYRQAAPYLWAAAVLWEVAMNLPVVPINEQTETFGMHFTGGVVACVLYYFVIKAYGLKFPAWWYTPVILYFFVSGLGVTNELFENFLYQTNIAVMPMSITDTWWDLTANTLGAATAFACAEVLRKLKTRAE